MTDPDPTEAPPRAALVPDVPVALGKLVRRVLCNNPGMMTGPGTNTYLVGIDEVAVIDAGSFTVDLAAKRVHRHGDEVHLTPTEWALLEVLVRHPGRLVSQRQLLQQVWGPQYGTELNYLRQYLAQLRRKLEPQPSAPRYLITEPGIGYRFVG